MKKLILITTLIFSLTTINACSQEEPDSSQKITEGKDQIEQNDVLDGEPKINGDREKTNTENEKELDREDQDYILYDNSEYKFTLKLPSSWENKYIVEKSIWVDESSESISFDFKSENVRSNIFKIIVTDESIPEEKWEDPFLVYLTKNESRTFSYIPAMEPSEVLLQEGNEDELAEVETMVREVSEIMSSFELEK